MKRSRRANAGKPAKKSRLEHEPVLFPCKIPVVLHKDIERDEQGNPIYDETGKPRYRCGFRIGGGIDQDPGKSPQGYPDKGVYLTFLYEGGPAHRAGLQLHDKLLQVNGHDMTVVTHKKAIEYIRRKPVLNCLVHRKGMPQLQQKPGLPQPQFQQFNPQQGGHYQNQYGPPPGSPGGQQMQQHYRPY